MVKINKNLKKIVDKIKSANIDAFGTDERLDYRKIYKDRFEKDIKQNKHLN